MQRDNFCCIGAELQNREISQYKAPQIYYYRSADNSETMEIMTTDGFFDPVYEKLKRNDIIFTYSPFENSLIYQKVISNKGGLVETETIGWTAESIVIDVSSFDNFEDTHLQDFLKSLDTKITYINSKICKYKINQDELSETIGESVFVPFDELENEVGYTNEGVSKIGGIVRDTRGTIGIITEEHKNAENIIEGVDITTVGTYAVKGRDFETPITDTNKGATMKEIEDVKTSSLQFKGYVYHLEPTGYTFHQGEMWINSVEMPTNFPVPASQIKIWNGSAWEDATEDYTPQYFHTFRDIENCDGYYWFGGEWKEMSTDMSTEYFQFNNITGLWEINPAYDNRLVHKDVAETITSLKTIAKNGDKLYFQNPDCDRTQNPTSNQYSAVKFVDKNNLTTMLIDTQLSTDGTTYGRFFTYKKGAESQQYGIKMQTDTNNKTRILLEGIDLDDTSNAKDIATTQYVRNKTDIMLQILNRTYQGRDLTQVFANEIANYSDEWAWIKARIQAGNYKDIYVGDYIPVVMSAGTVGGVEIAQQTFQCQIAGIDTYYQAADNAVGHHIDFISREVINTDITWNPTNSNNGTALETHPWLASQVYAWLNGINNYTTNAYGNLAHGGNYNNAGILQLLPAKLRNIIVEKRNLLDARYSPSVSLTYSTGWDWNNMGKLWLPNEMEVYDTQVRSNLGYAKGYWNPEANLSVGYPLFANSVYARIKKTSTGGRSRWWLSSATAYAGGTVCDVGYPGNASSDNTTLADIRCPLCFRIA